MALQELSIYTMVLTLESSIENHADIEQHFLEMGIEDYSLYKVPGCNHKTKNTGGVDENTSLFDVFAHSMVDDTSHDIYKNHMSMIRKAYHRGLERVLFMEEDARFEKHSSRDQIVKIKSWLDENPKAWDIFYLGSCPWPVIVSFPVAVNIVSIPSPYLCHSYILNRRGMKKILDRDLLDSIINLPIIHVDKLFASMTNLEKKGTYPSICFQQKSPALFEEAKKKMYLPMEFNQVNKIIETIAILWPLCILFLLSSTLTSYYLKIKMKSIQSPSNFLRIK